MRRLGLGVALGLVVGACVAFALVRHHPHMTVWDLPPEADAPGGFVGDHAPSASAPDDARGNPRRRKHEPKHTHDRDASSTTAVAEPSSDLPVSRDAAAADWPAGLVPVAASRVGAHDGASLSGAAFEVPSTPAAPLSGLRWLNGSRPSPEPAMLVLVFLGIGERDTPDVVPPLVARVHAMAARDVAVVGLAKACADYLAFDADSVRWLREQALDLPVAVLTGELERRYDVDRVPLAQVVVRGAVVWRGPPDALDEAELTRLHRRVDAVAER